MPAVLEQTFHDTLVELRCADLILHVVDASDTDMPSKIQTVELALQKLVSSETPVWIVANKTDACLFSDAPLGHASHVVYPISARKGEGVRTLMQDIIDWTTWRLGANHHHTGDASYVQKSGSR